MKSDVRSGNINMGQSSMMYNNSNVFNNGSSNTGVTNDLLNESDILLNPMIRVSIKNSYYYFHRMYISLLGDLYKSSS